MDPNLFHLDWERSIEALGGIIVLSFFVERVCALLFESRWWIRKFEDPDIDKWNSPDEASTSVNQRLLLPGLKYPLKELIGFILAFLICWKWHFDALSIIMLDNSNHILGIFVTAAIVAGGSKASISLFHKLLGVQSDAKAAQKKHYETRTSPQPTNKT